MLWLLCQKKVSLQAPEQVLYQAKEPYEWGFGITNLISTSFELKNKIEEKEI